jgi:hypothetical protein
VIEMVKSRKPRAPVRGTCIRTLVSAAAFAGILIGPVPLAGAAEAQLSVSPPEARPLHLVYDIYLGGFHTGRIELEIDIGHAREPAQAPARYRVVAETRSAGLIDYLIGFRSRAVSEGRQVGGTPHPTRHEVDNTWMGKPRSVRIRYADGAPSPHSRRDTPETVTIAPSPEVDERDPVPLDARVGAVDPLTAALRVTMIAAGPEGDGESLMRSTCVGAVPVFDGRRRYDIRTRSRARTTMGPRSAAGHRSTASSGFPAIPSCRAAPIPRTVNSGSRRSIRRCLRSPSASRPTSGSATHWCTSSPTGGAMPGRPSWRRRQARIGRRRFPA